MWNSEPSPEQISKWFNGFDLHKDLKHKQYVGGIVAICERGTWKPFVTAPTRLAYFRDWCDANEYSSTFVTEDAKPFPLKVNEKVTELIMMRTEVIVRDKDLNVVCSGTGSKSVAQTRKFKGNLYPDENALMKAETGSVARAIGLMGILALPGSGVATAEDMVEFEAAAQQVDAPQTKKATDPRAKSAGSNK